ncbi:hypothetical protein TPAR_08728 [Tolypocladium paradoxum]|uniref:BHLH domain-containing protein n=1 Tax=Tolypocladium paradoxum TaxID=94208 RepID=A0A2S4KLG9_9HYPO|nr:hypothetical protein TPAR_08728 [Tolypocladium paradoxum]
MSNMPKTQRIRPKTTTEPLSVTWEAAVNEVLKIKRHQRKVSEKARRDHLKKALARLGQLMMTPCCEGYMGAIDVAGRSPDAGPSAASFVGSKTDVVEFAIQYISCFQRYLLDVGHESKDAVSASLG